MTRSILKSVALAVFLAAGAAPALAQGTAITYQGQLKADGFLVDGVADFRFSLFTAASGGLLVGNTVTQNAVTVTEGLFSTPVDFGFDPYTAGNQTSFLQIEVRNPAGTGAFVPMGARQQLTAAPFSLATRGINVDGAGDVSLLTGTNRRISVPTAPFNANGTNLAISAGNGGTSGNAVDGGDLLLAAGSAFNSSQSFVRPGDVFIRSGGNSSIVGNAPNGGDIIMQTGGGFNAITERMRVTQTGNVGIGTATPPESLSVGSFGVPGAVDRYVQISTEGGNAHRAGLKLRHSNNNAGYTIESDERGPSIGGAFGLNFIDLNANPGNTPRSVMLIQKQTGNVGIGTTSPIARLEAVTSPGPLNDPVAIFRNETCGAPCGQEANTENVRLVNTAAAGSVGIGLMVEPGATINSVSDVWLGTGFGSGTDDNNFLIATKTSPTTLTNRLVVNGDNGNVGIGTDAPAARLHNVGTTRLDDALQFGVQNFTGAAGSNARMYRFGAGGNVSNLYLDMTASAPGSAFIFQANGNDRFFFDLSTGAALKTGGGAWGVLSDERTKTNIQPLTGTLDRLLQLKGHAYTYKPEFVDDGRALPGTQIGLVAQEVETVFPDWVTTGADGLKQVTERSTTALMVEALRDLRTEKDREIESLKARLEKLEALLTAQSK